MGSVDVLAFIRHFGFAFAMVAAVAHVLCILLLVNVWAGVALVSPARAWSRPCAYGVSKGICTYILPINSSLDNLLWLSSIT